MKVILQREVEKLGVPGDVVEVKSGYARNFLIPRGLAVVATKGGTRHAERLSKTHQDRVQNARLEVETAAAALAAQPISLPARAGEDGRLFGSVTAADVAAELAKNGTEVDRRDVRLEEPIRSVGAHEVQVHLAHDVVATVTVEVIAE